MGKLTDWKKEKDEANQKQIDNNIIMNPAAFNDFLDNIEDLDFNWAVDGNGWTLKVPLSESAIKYPKKELYPYTVKVELNDIDVVLTMGQHSKAFSEEECEKLFILCEWLESETQKPELKSLTEKFTEKNRNGPVSWG